MTCAGGATVLGYDGGGAEPSSAQRKEPGGGAGTCLLPEPAAVRAGTAGKGQLERSSCSTALASACIYQRHFNEH